MERFVFVISQEFIPSLFAENEEHAQAQCNHQANYNKIAVFPVKLGHIRKVHAVYTGNDRKRHENRCNGGKHTHDLIRPVRNTGLVGFS